MVSISVSRLTIATEPCRARNVVVPAAEGTLDNCPLCDASS